jgi:ketosteroid isomerase-like protein
MREVVVTPVRRGESQRSSRNLEERFVVRFPNLYRRIAAELTRRLGPRSRLRRVLLRRALLSAWASIDRRDFELNVVFFAPDVEFVFPAEMQKLGLEGPFRGHQGRIEAIEKWNEAWGTTELEPAYLLDLGNRLLCLGFWRNRARASGVPLEQEYAQLVTVREGLIVHDQSFFSWDEGLRTAGLAPEAMALTKQV